MRRYMVVLREVRTRGCPEDESETSEARNRLLFFDDEDAAAEALASYYENQDYSYQCGALWEGYVNVEGTEGER